MLNAPLDSKFVLVRNSQSSIICIPPSFDKSSNSVGVLQWGGSQESRLWRSSLIVKAASSWYCHHGNRCVTISKAKEAISQIALNLPSEIRQISRSYSWNCTHHYVKRNANLLRVPFLLLTNTKVCLNRHKHVEISFRQENNLRAETNSVTRNGMKHNGIALLKFPANISAKLLSSWLAPHSAPNTIPLTSGK